VELNHGDDFATAILLASVHARENITTDLLCKFLDEEVFEDIKNFNISLVLMANPDGVELSKHGIISVPDEYQKEILKMNNNSFDFSLWKANGQGVDINNNFDANFGTNVKSFVPCSAGFIGEFAESEIETKLLTNYTRSKHAFFTVSYHSKGEEIYYNFFQDKNSKKV
jgi:g-D-glutamyl-meso-diaminopimelate peptidase